ncbi:MAG: DEAD/DEAH box helicase, partial [Bdellovibrionota bacterium]
MNNFSDLSLPEALQRALTAMKFLTPTPIQAQSIPVAMSHRDLIGSAQTGSGKTAAFGIPMICSLLRRRDASGLILVPTRELAAQVTQVLRELTRFSPEISVVTLIGGAPMGPQMSALRRGARIVVATPGRLVDHLH